VDSIANPAFTSWTLSAYAIALLLAIALIYVRGWMRGRRPLHDHRDHGRMAAFLAGLVVAFLATAPGPTFMTSSVVGMFFSSEEGRRLLAYRVTESTSE
jgi:cytochrome c oxidase assembly factor CtaG